MSSLWECPQLNTEQPQRHRQQSQSHQQSITVNKPGRSTQSGVNSNRGRPRVQTERDQGRVFHMTQEDVRAASDVVAGMVQMNDYQMHVLFDSGATHSFITNKNVTKLSKETKRVKKGFIIGTPLGETVETIVVFEGVGININGCELEADLIPLELSDFDIILGMNWLGKNKARLDCFTKIVTFQGAKGETMVFKGERISNFTNIISGMVARKLLKKGCTTYLAYVINSKKGKIGLSDIPFVREFLDVFPGLPPEKEVEVTIDILPEVSPIAQPPYRMAPKELDELKIQLQELLDKGFIRPSN